MNKRHYEHTLPNIRGSLSNTYHSIGQPFSCLAIHPANRLAVRPSVHPAKSSSVRLYIQSIIHSFGRSFARPVEQPFYRFHSAKEYQNIGRLSV